MRSVGREPSSDAATATKGYHFLSLLLLAFLPSPSYGQSAIGFISIDCGLPEGNGYVTSNSISYTSDEKYVETGEKRNVSMEVSTNSGLAQRYMTLRSFPAGARNCYTLRPVEQGNKYLVRASFLYGNYDGLNQPHTFDLHLGVNLWQRVKTSSNNGNPVFAEIIAVALADSVSVCLVNTGFGMPFVSAIELRPLPDEIHPLVNASLSLVLFGNRRNYGGSPDGIIRYPDDPYDRLWFTPTKPVGWLNLSTVSNVKSERIADFLPPSAVMRTAATTASVSQSLDFSTDRSSTSDEIYVFLHFAELRQLGKNETREMDVYLNRILWSEGFTPRYLLSRQVYTTNHGAVERHSFSIRASNRSTLPPFLNALEVYALNRLVNRPTHGRDVNAILSIKEFYQVKRNWQGDPCQPQSFVWMGMSCTYDGFPRITTLNLSSSGLTGGIPNFIANLSNLQIL